MTAGARADPECVSQHCITCSDDGEPMTVVRVDRERGLALCNSDGGLPATVETALVEPVVEGQRLLVHAGTAIARLQPNSGEVAR
jgi:hydrogenase maturation factor